MINLEVGALRVMEISSLIRLSPHAHMKMKFGKKQKDGHNILLEI